MAGNGIARLGVSDHALPHLDARFMTTADNPPVHREKRLQTVFGKYVAKCECGWQTNSVPDRQYAREWLRRHIEYMTGTSHDLPTNPRR